METQKQMICNACDYTVLPVTMFSVAIKTVMWKCK